jgi:long-chain-fatty-acid--CoA ligase ACSBG
MKFAKACHKL